LINRRTCLPLLLAVLSCALGSARGQVTSGAGSEWPLWEKYRSGVAHPATTLKSSDLVRARANIARYDWARAYRDSSEKKAVEWSGKLTPAFLEQMIPATTPGSLSFTPCPACRDQHKPPNTHGVWTWSPDDPEHLVCDICHTVFPNTKYPESVVLKANYGGEQTFTYCGGDPFVIFSYKTGRPSFTGSIRSRKVNLMGILCRTMAEAYALTGKTEYADATRKILLRFADVYPHWLIHNGYGEVADMDPHIAARNINRLPADELCPPPTKPDRKMHTGYWTAGRAASSGQEGTFVRQVLESYDLTCEATKDGKPLYSASERRHIEKDLLLESTVLLTADTAINNKSVGNGTAATMVGMALGDPTLVRFGLGFFEKTLDGWFLPDGGTPESWSYALMTLNGIQSMGQAFRGYSDPPGYKDASGKRLEKIDLYTLPAYQRIWEAMYHGLQGDLKYPPLADSHRKDGIGARYAELMAANYPKNADFQALLRAVAGEKLAYGDPATAIYQRDPGLETKTTAPLTLPDYVYPKLQIGYLRAGTAGRDSALVLSASDWGGHHHEDSLNLYWWQSGTEQLSDLGYLWDHPLKTMTHRTFAHNTVLIDGEDQQTTGRGGKFLLFESGKSIKMMEAESKAYAKAGLYRRTVVQIETSPGARYVVDLFRVQGGSQQDYVFHGPSTALQTPPSETVASLSGTPLDLTNLHRLAPLSGQISLTWKTGTDKAFTALWPADSEEIPLLGDGWGQLDYKNSDAGATLPYIVRRRITKTNAETPTVFATVFEGHSAAGGTVRSLRRLPVPPGEENNTVALRIETTTGVDYVISCQVARPVTITTEQGPLTLSGRLAVVRTVNGNAVDSRIVEGKQLLWRGKKL
jgi:hypothetical protein